jgi:phospholipid/cholesterol/gamma-HCH transport system ATP-binding protein
MKAPALHLPRFRRDKSETPDGQPLSLVLGTPPSDRLVVIHIENLKNAFGPSVVHHHLALDVYQGEVMGLVGGSGTGKSVLLRTIIGLNRQKKGTIEVFGQDTAHMSTGQRKRLQSRWGVLFQDGALFSSLTVAENIQVPLREYCDLPQRTLDDIAATKISLVGLPQDAAHKYPSELSGGMKKRAGLARALALDPPLLFLDEPTAGLDPIGASAFDKLVKDLQRDLGLTVLMVTHDLDSLNAICDRIAVLLDKRVVVGTMQDLLTFDHPWVREYFHGPRGRAARAAEPQAAS